MQRLKTWANEWARVFEAGAAILGIIGLFAAVYAIWQTERSSQQVARQIQLSATQAVYAELLSLDKELSAHPTLRSCFVPESGSCPVEGEKSAAAEELASAQALAVAHLDVFDLFWTNAVDLGISPRRSNELDPQSERILYNETEEIDAWSGWSNWIQRSMSMPLMCDALEQHHLEYNDYFVEALADAGGCNIRLDGQRS